MKIFRTFYAIAGFIQQEIIGGQGEKKTKIADAGVFFSMAEKFHAFGAKGLTRLLHGMARAVNFYSGKALRGGKAGKAHACEAKDIQIHADDECD